MREKVKLVEPIKITTITSCGGWGNPIEGDTYEVREIEIDVRAFTLIPKGQAQTGDLDRDEIFFNHCDQVVILALEEFLRQVKSK